jgi:hypothetical protein
MPHNPRHVLMIKTEESLIDQRDNGVLTTDFTLRPAKAS